MTWDRRIPGALFSEFEEMGLELEEHRLALEVEYGPDEQEPLDLNDSNDFEAKP